MLLCVVSRHPDGKVRDQLLNMMFNLIKRPDRGQRSATPTSCVCCSITTPPPCRHVIMSGCVSFAKMNGTTRVESELLPQMWEQVTMIWREKRFPNPIYTVPVYTYLPSDHSQALRAATAGG